MLAICFSKICEPLSHDPIDVGLRELLPSAYELREFVALGFAHRGTRRGSCRLLACCGSGHASSFGFIVSPVSRLDATSSAATAVALPTKPVVSPSCA